MPQCKGKGNWMINMRVAPPSSKFRMDSSQVKLENKRVAYKGNQDIQRIQNIRYKILAEDKERMRKAKIEAEKAVITSLIGNARTVASAPTQRKSQTAEPSLPPMGTKRTAAVSGGSDEYQEVSKNVDTSEDEDNVVSSRPRPHTSYQSGSRVTKTPGSTSRSRSPRTKSAMAQAFGSAPVRSFQHFRSLLAQDSVSRDRYNTVRETVMQQKAQDHQIAKERLDVRLREFYKRLDSLLDRQKEDNSWRPSVTVNPLTSFTFNYS